MVLGIDVSTSITGFAVVADGQLVHYDSIDLRKHKNVFEPKIFGVELSIKILARSSFLISSEKKFITS